jgi:hypothetical protein
MTKSWTIGAQLSTSHSSIEALSLDRMLAALDRVRAVIDVDVLVVGPREIPEIFRAICRPSRGVGDVFLWYNLLSDIEGMEDCDLVVNWRGEPSRGWGGWAEKGPEINETYRFVCPNNPAPRTKTLRRLRELLSQYSFAGVFLDKMRFPSPANGLDEVMSCFCDYCHDLANAVDFDLDAVVKTLEERSIHVDDTATLSKHGPMFWLEALVATNPLLSRFIQFRMDSITRLVAEACGEAVELGRKVSLDLFSPSLAELVGQDYRALSKYCVWAKPMTYRVAQGPAGLRLEIPALVDGIARMFGLEEPQISDWATRYVAAFDHDTLRQTRNSAVPLPVMVGEIEAAVRALSPVPTYFGLELVSYPGVVDITPELVREMVQAGHAANASGLIVSWDLMHAPMDGIRALAAATK